jgi:hypothetical protein
MRVTSCDGYTVYKKYGFWNFIGDCFMSLATGGLWVIWIFVREMRKPGYVR